MDKMTILVGTAGQGVMRSVDGGDSWTRVGVTSGIHSDAVVRVMVVHPDDPNVLFIGTDQGLKRSDDAGAMWTRLGEELADACVWAIAIDSVEPNVMFAGTGTPGPAMLFRSDDAGASWRKLSMQAADECVAVGVPRVTGIAIDPVERNNIWVGIEVDGLRHSTDRGETWVTVDAIANPDVHSVAIADGASKTIYVVVNNEVFTSSDDGDSWNAVGVKQAFPLTYPRSLRIDPLDPNVAYVTLGDTTPGTTGAVMRTPDRGASWERVDLPVAPNSAMWVVEVEAFDPSVLFAASRYGYLYRSDDGGATLRKLPREFSEISSVRWVPA